MRPEAVPVRARLDRLAVLHPEPLGVRGRELQRLARREEAQRRVSLGDLARPQVAVGAESQPSVGRRGRRRLRRLGPLPRPRDVRCGVALLPSDARATDLLVGNPGVERDLARDLGEHHRPGVERELVAERRRQLDQDLPAHPDSVGTRDRRAQPLQAAVRVGHRALLLGVALGGEHDVGAARRLVAEHRAGDHEVGVVERVPPTRAVAAVSDRVRVDEDHRRELVGVEQPRDLRRVGPRGGLSVAGSGVGQAADLAQAARVALSGDLKQSGAVAIAQPEGVRQREQLLRRAMLAAGELLAPHDDDVARIPKRRGEPLSVLAVAARSLRRAGAHRRRERGEQGGGVTGRVADDLRRAAVQRRGARGGDEEPGARSPHRLANSQVEYRHRVERVRAHDEDRARAVEIGHCRRKLRSGELEPPLAVDRPAVARVDMRRVERFPNDPLHEVALLVRGRAADERGGAPARGAEPRGGGVDRLGPARVAELTRLAHERLGDPIRRRDHLVAEAALVAQPPVVDVEVVATQHPLDPLVADREQDVALGRAQGADRAGVLDVPRAGAEAVRLGGQRPDGAQLDDVAVEGCDVGAVVERPHEGAVAALEQLELLVLGHLLAEPDAPIAEDAALTVDLDQGRERKRLLEVALGVGEAALSRAPAHRDVLERALAALVAHRAIERVVDEQELDNRLLSHLHAIGPRVHHHPVADRRRACSLQLRDPLDLDQAHAARADRVAELRLVAEHRDLDVPQLCGVDEHRSLRRRHLDAVDDEGGRVAVPLDSQPLEHQWDLALTLPPSEPTPPPPRVAALRPPGLPRSRARTRRGICAPCFPPASPSSRRARTGSCR